MKLKVFYLKIMGYESDYGTLANKPAPDPLLNA